MRRNAFERKKKKLGLKFNPGLAGANQPSNKLARVTGKETGFGGRCGVFYN